MAGASLSAAQVDELVRSVAALPALRLPARMAASSATGDAERSEYLGALLRHDPGVFLERHGRLIDAGQRRAFEPLRGDYEVDFYCKLLEDEEAAAAATRGESGGQKVSSTAKNRRLAKLQRLSNEGFFDEDAARRRAPLLHHQYLGQYNKPSGPPVGGASLHERLMEQQDEAALRTRMQQELAEERRAGAAFEATLSESESESDSEPECEPAVGGGSGQPAGAAASRQGEGVDVPSISAEELEQNRAEFCDLMQARFLSGEDGGAEADADESLDSHWAKEAAQDAEDAYFG